ncbi:MAG: transposase [Verrucomicrobia bacterium]|nr:transposase [Verrucomicrobiota bacterium]MDA1007080.1 transposase [Verrucomicrobiota bacterium]
MPSNAPLGWHSRGYLPHLDALGELQALTFRLADSVPDKVIKAWKQELDSSPPKAAAIALQRKIATYEDAGHGSCLLRIPEHAEVVQNALLHFDGTRYRLLEWAVMPNHVHVLVQPLNDRLGRIIKSWKTYTARAINQATGTSGTLWARDYHDRYIRDEEHLLNCRNYIRMNPVKAGLCTTPEAWPFSSASRDHQ